MKLAIPFLLAALLVIALMLRALKDESAPVSAPYTPVVQDAVSPQTERPIPPPAAEPVIDAEETVTEPAETELSDADFLRILQEFGFGRLENEWRDWALSRGFSAMENAGSYQLDQPYDQYDNETLRGLADNGDMWAQQILAKRISRSNPAEAIELYKQAATRGSINAMGEMAGLYLRIADKRREVEFKSDELALEQVYAMRDAPVSPEVAGYAWTAVAEMAGTEPMFGNIAASQFRRRLTDDQKAEGCVIAQGLYDEAMAQREALGLGDFNRQPPPLVYNNPGAGSACSENSAPALDLSGCREMNMTRDGKTNTIWLCADESP
ncbi:MAG: hypothetical protein HKM98_07360 [Gammaproteobacteria bacterium]|nr:hypothetical protein [Gammaproteobacteria bacterium]